MWRSQITAKPYTVSITALFETHCTNNRSETFENSTSKVKLETSGEAFETERGVRQGDHLSPKLYKAVLQDISSKINWEQKGIMLNGKYRNQLIFADDIAILAETPKDLEKMVTSLNHESKKVGFDN